MPKLHARPSDNRCRASCSSRQLWPARGHLQTERTDRRIHDIHNDRLRGFLRSEDGIWSIRNWIKRKAPFADASDERSPMMKIDYEANFTIDICEPSLKAITPAFFQLQSLLLSDFFGKVVRGFAEHYMRLKCKPFSCPQCGNREAFIWKSRRAKTTPLLTIFGMVNLPQLQIKCSCCGYNRSVLEHFFLSTSNIIVIIIQKEVG